jgi:3-phenylpropionate/cinnamic acid dioxygenase small subunit
MRNTAISTELFRDVEAFLYLEARMLEENCFDDWLDCFADDVRYWMPIRESTDGSLGASLGPANEADTFALFDDDKKSLELRVLRIKTGDAHAEVPPSITQRLVTNITVEPAAADDSLRVRSSFMVYQERRGQHGVTFFGKRDDVLRVTQGKLKITRRRIDLAQTILPTTISIFF